LLQNHATTLPGSLFLLSPLCTGGGALALHHRRMACKPPACPGVSTLLAGETPALQPEGTTVIVVVQAFSLHLQASGLPKRARSARPNLGGAGARGTAIPLRTPGSLQFFTGPLLERVPCRSSARQSLAVPSTQGVFESVSGQDHLWKPWDARLRASLGVTIANTADPKGRWRSEPKKDTVAFFKTCERAPCELLAPRRENLPMCTVPDPPLP